jgi:MerR family transcriptional regulator, thiopeptide resistance regulator
MRTQVTVEEWKAMFRAIGLDDDKMHAWHRVFESRHPEGHEDFLSRLGLSAEEIEKIRAKCR